METIKHALEDKSGYCMRLSNGQRWHIIAAEGMRSWTRKWASIMGLKLCNGKGYPRLIFIRREGKRDGWSEPICWLDQKARENLPINGWKAVKFPPIQVWSHRKVSDVICEIESEQSYELDVAKMLLAVYPIYVRAQDCGGMPFHAALVQRRGVGILLAASGNTGKSTCCRRLRSPWQTLCDDEALIVRDDQQRYMAHPFPTWSNYLWRRSRQTWNVEKHVPLLAIFFLEQGETDAVYTMGGGQAAVSVTQSALQAYPPNWRGLDVYERRTFRKKLFENACELIKSVPAYKLRVSLNGRFWEEMEKVLP